MSLEQRECAAKSAAKLFVAHPLFKKSQYIATYLARDDEFHAQPIIQEIWHAQKHCYLPVLSAHKKNFLDFVLFKEQDSLRPNRYKILEPENTSEKIPSENLDIVLVPLVGFDLHGHRLGMGGGYYDRSFEFLLGKSSTKPIMIGLGYEAQHVEQLPFDEWDVSLHGVLTEKNLIIF